MRQAAGRMEQRLAREIEGAGPAARIRGLDAELPLEMRKILAHRQGCRGENPGARMVQHLLAEQLRRHQRRDMQLQRLAEDLDPANFEFCRLFPDSREQRARRLGAPRAGVQAFRTLGLLAERLAERRQRRGQCRQRFGKAGFAQRLRPAQPQALFREAQAQIARSLVEPGRELV